MIRTWCRFMVYISLKKSIQPFLEKNFQVVNTFKRFTTKYFPVETIIKERKTSNLAPIARKMVRRLKQGGTPFARVSPEEFRKLSITEQASGVAAIFRQPILKLGEVKPRDSLC